MNGELTSLALATASGAALLVLSSLAAVGARRTLTFVRGVGLFGVFLAFFVGNVLQSLARPLLAARPYTLAFLPPTVLHAQGLAEDPDLRTRYNVDARLRYLPVRGANVVDLESEYEPQLQGFRLAVVPPVVHSSPTKLPPRVIAMGEAEFGKEIDGLYRQAWATVERAGRGPEFRSEQRLADFIATASIGFLVLGVVGLLGGLLPLAGRMVATVWDSLRLLRRTSGPGYRGARKRALKFGTRALAHWHFAESRSFASLATFGLLLTLGGAVLGLLHEEESRVLAHAVFREAREIRIEGKK